MLVPIGTSRDACLEMQAVRVAPNQVMIVVQDVTAEHRLALREREIAVELQLAMLGRADEVPGLSVGVTYRAADAELEVGGDWYDVIALPDGQAGLVVGDIVGHNLSATTAMGQLRSALRATAQFRPEPAELLTPDRPARPADRRRAVGHPRLRPARRCLRRAQLRQRRATRRCWWPGPTAAPATWPAAAVSR